MSVVLDAIAGAAFSRSESAITGDQYAFAFNAKPVIESFSENHGMNLSL
jgi:hypothetical protein